MHGVHRESNFFSLSPFLPHLFDGKCIYQYASKIFQYLLRI